MLTYLLQSSTCLIILYGIYHFILSEMTFFKYNRAYLLLSILASLMIPILAPLLVLPEESVPVLHWSHIAGDITYIVADNAVTVFDWKGLMGNILWVNLFCGCRGRIAQNDVWIIQDIQILPTRTKRRF
jgi:hypothetical protein